MRKYQKDPPQISFKVFFNKTGFIQHQRQRIGAGFTLVELLVVIAVIGLLAAGLLILVNPLGQLQKARNAQRKSDLRQIANALERYYSVNGSYPNTSGSWCGAIGSYWECSFGADWIPGLVASGELKVLLKDPRSGQGNSSNTTQPACNDPKANYYLYNSNGKDYKLLAHCTPEGLMSPTDSFYDYARPTWAWTIYSPGGANW